MSEKMTHVRSRLEQGLRTVIKALGKRDIELSGSIGYVNQEFDFGFKFLPKSASTSVLKALYYLNHDQIFCAKDHGFGVHRWGRINSGKLSTVNNRVIVIRDPVRRFLSGYSNRVNFHQSLSKKAMEKNRPNALPKIEVFNPTLSEFINSFSLYMQVKTIDHHFRPISGHLTGVPLSFYNHVVKIEEAAGIKDILIQIFGKDFEFTREQATGEKIPIGALTYQQLSKITEFYTSDYRLLEGYYSKQDVFDEWENTREKHKVEL
jgi:hypothetical protein